MTYQKANNADTVSGRQEFLVFVLNEQEYGIDILKVQEIRGYQEQSVTRIANVPPFVKGVTNLRGVIVPIIDMRIKFNLPDVKYDNQTVVVILNVADRVIGVVVDGVSDVLTLAAEQISDAPQLDRKSTRLNSSHVAISYAVFCLKKT